MRQEGYLRRRYPLAQRAEQAVRVAFSGVDWESPDSDPTAIAQHLAKVESLAGLTITFTPVSDLAEE